MMSDKIEFDLDSFKPADYPAADLSNEQYELNLDSILERSGSDAIVVLREHRLITQLWFRYCFSDCVPFSAAINIASQGINVIAVRLGLEAGEINHLCNLQLDQHDDSLFESFWRITKILSCIAGQGEANAQQIISTDCLLSLSNFPVSNTNWLKGWIKYNLTAAEYDRMFNIFYYTIKRASDRLLDEIANTQSLEKFENLIGYKKTDELKTNAPKLISTKIQDYQ